MKSCVFVWTSFKKRMFSNCYVNSYKITESKELELKETESRLHPNTISFLK